jgi:hypothetical protein
MAHKGQSGASMSWVQRRTPCSHEWSSWERAGAFDARSRRSCSECNRIQVRAASKGKAPLSRHRWSAWRTLGNGDRQRECFKAGCDEVEVCRAPS